MAIVCYCTALNKQVLRCPCPFNFYEPDVSTRFTLHPHIPIQVHKTHVEQEFSPPPPHRPWGFIAKKLRVTWDVATGQLLPDPAQPTAPHDTRVVNFRLSHSNFVTRRASKQPRCQVKSPSRETSSTWAQLGKDSVFAPNASTKTVPDPEHCVLDLFI